MSLVETAVLGALVLVPLWLIAILDIALAQFTDGSTRIVWAIIVIFVPFGCLLYLVVGRQGVRSGGLGFLHRS